MGANDVFEEELVLRLGMSEAWDIVSLDVNNDNAARLDRPVRNACLEVNETGPIIWLLPRSIDSDGARIPAVGWKIINHNMERASSVGFAW